METKKSKKKAVFISLIIFLLIAAAAVIILLTSKSGVTKKYNEKYYFVKDYIKAQYDIDAEIADVEIIKEKHAGKKKLRYIFRFKEDCYEDLNAVFLQDEELNENNMNFLDLQYKNENGSIHSMVDDEDFVLKKPVIYLYPEEETDINIKLSFDENTRLSCTYPEYDKETGWNVTAQPDSVLTDKNGNEYSYLFWEAETTKQWDMSSGFVVKGEDTAEFLREKLSYLGLTPREYNDFIVYWMPDMQDNNYNLITFRTDEYTDMARLEVTPEPESVQRVFMTFKALDEYQEIDEQVLEPFERHGYTLIEWGGSELQ